MLNFKSTPCLTSGITFAAAMALTPGCTSGPGASNAAADYVLTNGRVYTVNAKQPWAEAIAVKGNEIVFVGSSAEAKNLIGEATKVADLDGRMVMPGIIDTHLHTMLASIAGSGLLVKSKAMDETLAEIAQFAAANPERKVIFGWGFANDLFGPEGADKRLLDEIIPGRPVFIVRSDGHSAWANSKALEAAGIDKDTPDPAPPAGVLGRDANGNPTGAVNGAPANVWFVNRLPGVVTTETLKDATVATLNDFSEHGITGCFDAGAPMAADVAYATLDELTRSGQNPLRIQAAYYALAYEPEKAVPETIELSKKYCSPNFSVTALKITVDGVVENRKAAVFEPYLDTGDRGALSFDPELAVGMAEKAAAAGLDIYMHTVGDRAVDLGLTIAEAVRSAGFKDTHVTLSHVQLVRKADIPRFARAGVFLNSSSHWWQRYDAYYGPVLGKERTEYLYPFRPIIDDGVVFINGSDYPADPEFNPFLHLEVAVTRRGAGAPRTQPELTPGNTLSIGEAIESYTINGAKFLRMKDQIGTLETGKLADLIVLDQNIVEIEPNQIHKTKVLMTMIVLAVVLGFLLGPQLLHGLDAFAHHAETLGVQRAVVLDLGLVPAASDTE